ncbi:hypothetical protein EVB81_208 [Rhizobium phage RHph_I46]|uniref:Uncharacterized protein n=1 Tax=Rhizobium phage RHph_I1_9 TaxID=2509729 RepID=A0A7S5UZQ2_9CAUD|nr:hypothetical protein PP936_gp206 [Rhizobium phage RHph_I1_9]QIG69777.1 hypothetical protein EVB81_208 [Rhizobium phage RHph_I46]QIG71058.1 hypothetical protein EVB92_208 [Rhizobium phage RHph_I9]QIG73643.1 hypothetical protein EVC04_206 [Rhizobium phage RHph_I1_9]QIG76397.1 hypothetical protein EVC25_208 [Rhizobium phage RHph_I34]
MTELRLSRSDFEALPTLQNLRDQGLNGRDLINRKYRSISENAPRVFKKTIRKSELSWNNVVVTQIWDVVFTD